MSLKPYAVREILRSCLHSNVLVSYGVFTIIASRRRAIINGKCYSKIYKQTAAKWCLNYIYEGERRKSTASDYLKWQKPNGAAPPTFPLTSILHAPLMWKIYIIQFKMPFQCIRTSKAAHTLAFWKYLLLNLSCIYFYATNISAL